MPTSNLELRRSTILLEVHRLLSSPTLSKEQGARAELLLGLAEQLDTEVRHGNHLRRARLTENELDMGMRTERTRDLDQVRQDFVTALCFGASALPDERRALSLGTDSAGGFLSPQVFSDRVFVAMKGFDPLFDPAVVTMIETKNGNACPIPLADDTSASASIVGENVQLNTTTDVTFDQLLLQKASSWKTSMVKASLELLQDSAFDIEQFLAKAFAARFARGIGAAFYTTLVGAASSGVSAAATVITADNLFDLIDSIDAAYLGSRCCWLMRRSTLTYIRKLKDTAGLPVFPLDRDADGNFLLLDFPVRISPSADAIGTTNKSVLFGDLGFFVVRTVADSIRIRRFGETYATSAQVGFSGLIRANCGLAKASSADSPVKYLAHA